MVADRGHRVYNDAVLIFTACAPAVSDQPVEGDPHARRLLFSEAPAEVECVSTEGDRLRHAGATEMVVHGLLADTEYACRGEAFDAEAVFTTDPLPESLPLPVVEVAGDAAEVGYRLTNVFRNSSNGTGLFAVDAYLVIFDAEGRPRWHQAGDFGADTDVSLVGDQILVGGFSGNTDHDAVRPRLMSLTDEVDWLAKEQPASVSNIPGSWHHDAGLGLDGDVIYALDRESAAGFEGFVLKALSLETGDPDWYWSSVEEGLESLVPRDGADTDPWHANAAWEAEEDGARVFYLSLKEASVVLRVDQASGAVTDIFGEGGNWSLAGDAEWFHHQHDVKVYDGDTMLVFDNGEAQTRILELDLDFGSRTATVTRSWTEPDWYIDRWGGVDRVGEALDVARPRFIGDSPTASLFRIEPDDGISWQLTWEDDAVSVYRSETLGPDDLFGIVE